MNPESPALPASVLIVCLCAEWCVVCRDYRGRFLQMQSNFPTAKFLWIDVEDEADLVDPLEVENFPTLLLVVGDETRFFGPVTPQADTLERLIRSQLQDHGVRALGNRDVTELVGRIRSQSSV